MDQDAGWGDYYDQNDVLGEVVSLMSGFDYSPNLGPVGSGALGTYYPGDTTGDAAALNYLGFYPDPLVASHVGTTGNQRGDMGAQAGAWDPTFQTAVRDFQTFGGLAVDGWIGPATRTAIANAVAAKNSQVGPLGPPQIVPPNVLPPSLPQITPPSSPQAPPAPPHAAGMSTGEKVVLGVVGVGVIYGIYKLVT